MTTPALPAELLRPVKTINEWLQPFGYSLLVDRELPYGDEPADGLLGIYDAGSVFEKEIRINIFTDHIRLATTGNRLPRRRYERECALTVFHETGHALMEQIIDWMENIEEAARLADGPFGDKYYDILNDDFLSEEQVVEDFAHAFIRGRDGLLGECFREMSDYLSSCD